MSKWTHVVGCIRIDGMPTIAPTHTVEAIQDVLGPMCLFDNWDDASVLPRGSEGSLQYQVIVYNTGLPWIAIPIWGDLSDYTDDVEIKKWFESILKKFSDFSKGIIRDACLRVQVEGNEPILLQNKEQ